MIYHRRQALIQTACLATFLALFNDVHVNGKDVETKNSGPYHGRRRDVSQSPVQIEEEERKVQRIDWYSNMLSALDSMETEYYMCSIGSWPDAIDWTAEVIAAQVSTSLFTVSEYTSHQSTTLQHAHENLINRYFTHITSFFFGEDAFGLRTQAYDDMLWVVLGWLESIKFINLHSNLHYAERPSKNQFDSKKSLWYARQFIPQFSHRARLFYDLASRGWDTKLCDGGMVWNPRLMPYKNAITNELFITASIWMYLYFPGDDDPSPFVSSKSQESTGLHPVNPHDPKFLHTAILAYSWLRSSNMRNSAGLYVDGFHIRGWRGGKRPSNGTGKCDIRDEKVYTYNQGVVLSGLRGLWEATGNRTYLEDGYDLIRAVRTATGWQHRDDDDRKRDWAGLGRGGVLEEECDWSGGCSQDGQTFKGIFFWHFASFCAPLPSKEDGSGSRLDKERPWLDDKRTYILHRWNCDSYRSWVEGNAKAAWITRDEDNLMGTWWGRKAWRGGGEDISRLMPPPQSNGTDYRNHGVPFNEIWRLAPFNEGDVLDLRQLDPYFSSNMNRNWKHSVSNKRDKFETSDLNDRGRGRTVETQSSGLSVIRAAWKMELERRQRQR